MTSHYGPTIVQSATEIYQFTFSLDSAYVSGGEFFYRELYSVKALHRGLRRLADPVSLILDLLNPKSTGFDRLSRTTTVPSFESFRSGFFVLSR